MSKSQFDRWLACLLQETPLRTNSLIVTLFGDAIEPHGGTVWLGNLIDLVAPLGINDRAIRTSVFRLAQEDWLHATPVGRRSAYGITASGRRRINHAYRRIYDTSHKSWNGEWQIAIIPEGTLASSDRDTLRRDLLWDGYGAITPGVFAHPSGDVERLRDVLRQTGSEDKLVLFKATALAEITAQPLCTLVHQCWHLDRLAEDYRQFVERFQPALKWLAQEELKDPEQCFVLRTLLIHEFRRVQLRDPQLPDALLDCNWLGHTARQLCRELYEKTLPPSEHYLMETLETPDGRLPPANTSFYERFGGLAINNWGINGEV